VDIEGGDTGAGRIKTTDQRVPTFAHDGTTVAVSVVMVMHRHCTTSLLTRTCKGSTAQHNLSPLLLKANCDPGPSSP
jgi:hypothetical protein